jgi:hypothetical protein
MNLRALRTLWTLGALGTFIIGAPQRGPDGTGEISGAVVTTSVPPTPLARVLVTISGKSLTPSRTIITDEQGGFAFRSLPEGSFTIAAARPPYVKTSFGAKRPGRPGTPINLAAGQRVAGITIPLARGAAIMGVIRNANGEAAPGVRVEVTPATLDAQAGPPGPPVVTDDRGVYRAFGLPPGKYVVTAGVTDTGISVLTRFSDAEMDAILARLQRRSAFVPATGGATVAGAPGAGPPRPDSSARQTTYGYAPIYYPGTADPDQATTLALAEGEERAGIDIGLQLVRTAAIEGRVSIAGGALPSGTQVTLTRQAQPGATVAGVQGGGGGGGGFVGGGSIGTTRQPDAAGDFRFTGILPGRYRLVARAMTMTPVPPPAPTTASVTPVTAPAAYTVTGVFWALTDVTVGDDDLSGLALTLQPGLRLSGRIAFDARALTPPRDLTTIRLRLADANGASNFVPASASGRADGTFEITGIVPGTYRMTSPLSDAGWWLRSVDVNGRDVLDFPLEIGSAGDVSGAVATFTDRHTELSGTLQNAANVPAPDYFVVVFSSERAFWRPASRRVQFTRPGTDGRFAFRDLPAGDYLIAALIDMEPSDLLDASFMERLIPGAQPVHLNDGEKKTQDLKLVR